MDLCARGWSDRTVAEQLRVSRGTLAKWRQSKDFTDAVDEARAALLAAWRAKLNDLGELAVETLKKAMESIDQEGRGPTAVRAAALVAKSLGILRKHEEPAGSGDEPIEVLWAKMEPGE